MTSVAIMLAACGGGSGKGDVTPPDTNITNNPFPSSTSQISAEFSFTSEAGAVFECSLDGDSFVSCSSPVNYQSLLEGDRSFKVRAIDSAGNKDSEPAIYLWAIDTSPPNTTIENDPFPALTNQTSAKFSLAATEPGAAFECSLDEAPFVACSSPVNYENLVGGGHSFKVRATDIAGNTGPASAIYRWVIDNTPPDTDITNDPFPDPTNQTGVEFSFTSEVEVVFECGLDDAPFADCSSPVNYENLVEGGHSFKVRAIDVAGNVGAAVAYNWAIDIMQPDTDITNDPFPAPTNQTSAEFSFKATEVGASFECSLDDALFVDCSSPVNYENLVEGDYSFKVRAIDIVGNKDPTAAIYRWVVDTTSPETEIENDPFPDPTYEISVEFSFTSEADAVFECSLDDDAFVDCSSPVNYEKLAAGDHSFKVRATDVVGNVGAAANYDWEFYGEDPLYKDQWHLKNTGQAGNDGVPGTEGEDINVEPVWNSCADNSCRGEGVRITVVDDGLEIEHEDLKANVVPDKSYDYVVGEYADPSPPRGAIGHGNNVAGVIAARDLNGVGVRGVAPRAELVGYNYLMAQTSENESDAMTRDAEQNHVSNNSWGVTDSTGLLFESRAVWRTAIGTGHRIGRGGLGTVYVWAAGNGGDLNQQFIDNSNYDGYANYRGVIAVGSVTNVGQRSINSEQGANLLVSAPGGERCIKHGIVTTDSTGDDGFNSGLLTIDYLDDNYTACFGGTSASAPMVSGVAALVLQANPGLGWRDVHAILARSARKNDPSHSDWQINGAGLHVNHHYGFGVVDAQAAVSLAKNWTNLQQPEKKFSTQEINVDQAIEDNDGTSVESTFEVKSSGINNIEFVEIRFSADHGYSADLEITLLNVATGTTSRLAEEHGCKPRCVPYNNWRFGSTRHLGESADGGWRLIVEDKSEGDKGTFQSWKLTFYGS